MKKLLAFPIMLSLICITGTAPVEAKRNNPGVSTPKCTRKRPCSRLPLLPSPPRKPKPCNIWTCTSSPGGTPGAIGEPIDFGKPMPRPWNKPRPGTQWR